MPIEILAVVVVVAVLVFAVPVRRLVLSGHSGWTVIGYIALLLLLAAAVTEVRPLARYLLPILGLAYIAPFITLGGGIDRLLGRRGPVVRVTPVESRAIRPPRNVTPPDDAMDADDHHPPAGPAAGPPA
jgi:hypothetical protein